MHFKKVLVARQDFVTALILLLLGFVFRWLYVLDLEITDPLRGDAGSYYIYAKNLIEHGVFSKDRSGVPSADSYWAPGYPAFLAICFKIADVFNINFYPLALFLQACMGGCITLLTYLTGRFFLTASSAFLAAVLTVLSPHLNTLGANILSETLFSFLLVFSLYVFLKASRDDVSWKLWASTGFLFGLTYLTNPVVLFIPFLLLFFHIYNRRKLSGIIKLLQVRLPFLIIFLAFVGGWQARDVVNVSNEKESTSDRAFLNLVIGSHQNYHSIWRENVLERGYSTKLINPADQDYEEYKSNHQGFYRELLHRVKANPQHYMNWYLIQKPLEFFGWNILAGEGDIYQYPVNSSIYNTSTFALISLVIMKQLHLWLVGAALLGLYFVVRQKNAARNEAILFVYIPLFYITAVYVLLHTDGRYSIPIRPEVYLCAVYAIAKICSLVKRLNAATKA